jgi:hypothetical protein
MTTRREFLGLSAVAIASLTTLSLSASDPRRFGVQLYTVRKEAEANLPRVLQQVRAIGTTKLKLIGTSIVIPPKDCEE